MLVVFIACIQKSLLYFFIYILKNYFRKNSGKFRSYNNTICFIIIHSSHYTVPIISERLTFSSKMLFIFVLASTNSPSDRMSVYAIKTTLNVKLVQMFKSLLCILISIIFIELIDIRVFFITKICLEIFVFIEE